MCVNPPKDPGGGADKLVKEPPNPLGKPFVGTGNPFVGVDNSPDGADPNNEF